MLAWFDGAYQNAAPAMIGNEKARYLATPPAPDLLAAIIEDTLNWSGVPTMPDLGDLRLASRGGLHFAFNYGQAAAEVPAKPSAKFLIGERLIAPVGVAIWDEDNI